MGAWVTQIELGRAKAIFQDKIEIMKKIIILVAVIGLGIVGIALYFVLQQKSPTITESPQNEVTVTENLIKLTEEKIFDYWLNKISGEVYYLNEEGRIYKISSNGEGQATGAKASENLSYLKPSGSGSLILVAFGYPQNPTFAIHDLSKKTWRALPAGTTAAAWDPKSDNRVAYFKDNGGTGRLNIITLSDGKSKEILRLAQKDLDLDWVLPDLIYLKERPSARVASSLWSYNLTTKVIKTVASEESGLMTQWNPKGQIGLKWALGFSLIDNNGQILAGINLKTLPNKCAFGGTTIYCAAPSGQSRTATINLPFATFPDEYFKRVVQFSSDIYSLSLIDANKSTIQPMKIFDSNLADVNIDAERLEIKGDRLLFINRFDRGLYSLSF